HEIGGGLAEVDPRRIEEQVADPSGREDGVHDVLLEHVPGDGDRIVGLHPAEVRDLRARGLLDRLGEHRQLSLHDAARQEGRTSQKPTKLGCARWAAAKASRMKYSARGASRRTMWVFAILSSFASARDSSSA